MGPEPEHKRQYSPRELRLLVVSLMVPMITVSFSQTVINTALPTMLSELDSPGSVAWVVSAFLVTATVAMVVFGSLGDQIDRKYLALAALALFGIGSVIGGFAHTIEAVILARLVQGFGGGGVMVLTQTIMAHAAPARERARFAGAFGSVWAVATIGGALLGGWMTDGPGWTWTFLVNLPIVAIAAILLIRWVKRSTDVPRRFRPDLLGISLLTLITTGIVALTSATTYFIRTPLILAAFIGILVIATAIFVVVQSRTPFPTFPRSVLENRTFILATSAGVLINGFSMFVVLSYLPSYAQMALGFSAGEAGLLLIPLIIGTVAASTITGLVVSHTGRFKMIPIAGTLLATLALWLLSTMDENSDPWQFGAYSVLFGVGVGTSVLLLTLLVQDALPRSMVGTATAANNYFRQAGASVGVAFLGAIFASRLSQSLAVSAESLEGLDSFDPRILRPETLAALSEPVQMAVMHAYGTSIPPLFAFLIPLTLFATVLLCFLPNKPLSTHPVQHHEIP